MKKLTLALVFSLLLLASVVHSQVDYVDRNPNLDDGYESDRQHDSDEQPHDSDGQHHDSDGQPRDSDGQPRDSDGQPHDQNQPHPYGPEEQHDLPEATQGPQPEEGPNQNDYHSTSGQRRERRRERQGDMGQGRKGNDNDGQNMGEDAQFNDRPEGGRGGGRRRRREQNQQMGMDQDGSGPQFSGQDDSSGHHQKPRDRQNQQGMRDDKPNGQDMDQSQDPDQHDGHKRGREHHKDQQGNDFDFQAFKNYQKQKDYTLDQRFGKNKKNDQDQPQTQQNDQPDDNGRQGGFEYIKKKLQQWMNPGKQQDTQDPKAPESP